MNFRQTLPRGTILDGIYEIEQLLGSGGFGKIYRVWDRKLDQRFAIKEFFPIKTATRLGLTVHPAAESGRPDFDAGLKRFTREARHLAAFAHPNIVRVFRSFEENGTSYIVLEYVEGSDLDDWLRVLARPPSQEEIDRLAIPLLDALETVHTAQILHRDIQPRNIRIRSRDGTPVFLDFGLSRPIEPLEAGQTSAVAVAHGYAPAESYVTGTQFHGPWTDVYGLAAVFYRALAGEPPPEAPERLLDDHIVPVKSLPGSSEYRDGFVDGLDWGLQINPADRPQNIAQWRKVLIDGKPRVDKSAAEPSVFFRTEGQGEVRVIRPDDAMTAVEADSAEPSAFLGWGGQEESPATLPDGAMTAGAPPRKKKSSAPAVALLLFGAVTFATLYAGGNGILHFLGRDEESLRRSAEAEEAKRKAEVARRNEADRARRAAEDARRKEEERARLAAEEARQKQETDRVRTLLAEAKREEEERGRLAGAETRQKEADRLARVAAETEAAAETARKEADQARRAAEEARRREEKEKTRLAAEEARRKREEADQARRLVEEAKRYEEEEKARQAEAEIHRKQEADRLARAAAEAEAAAETARKKKADQERRVAEDARRREEQEKARLAAEEARRKQEAGRHARAAAEAEAAADAAQKKKADQEQRAAEEARRREEEREKARLAAAETRRKQEEADQARRLVEEVRRKEDEEKVRLAEAEAQQKQEADRIARAAADADAEAEAVRKKKAERQNARFWKELVPGTNGAITAIALSNDGKQVAAGTQSGVLKVLRVDGFDRLEEVSSANFQPPARVSALALAPDGSGFLGAAAGQNDAIAVYDVRSVAGRLLKKTGGGEGPKRRVRAWAAAAGGFAVLSVVEADGRRSAQIERWQFDGKQAANPTALDTGERGIMAAAFSPKLDRLAVALRQDDATSGNILFFRLGEKIPVVTLARTGATPRSLAFSADGRILAVAGQTGYIELWDAEGTNIKPEELRPAFDPSQNTHYELTALAFSADGRYLASADESGRIYYWDLQSNPKLARQVVGTPRQHIGWLAFLNNSEGDAVLLSPWSNGGVYRIALGGN
jgi:serine/threonine protein kinase